MAMTKEQLKRANAAFAANPLIGRPTLRKVSGCTDWAAAEFLHDMRDARDLGVSRDAAVMERNARKALDAKAEADGLRGDLRALRKDRDAVLSEYTDFRKARPVPAARAAARPVQAKADKVRVSCGDLHGMMMDQNAVAAFLRDLRVLDPDEVVMLGDMLECGGFLAKHHAIGFVALTDYSYQEDVKATNWFLDEVQKAAPRAVIHALSGNHSDRIERWCVDQAMANKRDSQFLLDALGPQAVLRLDERGIKWYRRSEIYHEGLPRGWLRLGKMCYVHELGASKNAARDAVTRAAANVTFGHTHRADEATVVFPGVGIVKAFNHGCLSQIQPIWKHSDPTSWSQGYGIEIIAKSGNFQHIHVPIWRGESLAGVMINRFKA